MRAIASRAKRARLPKADGVQRDVDPYQSGPTCKQTYKSGVFLFLFSKRSITIMNILDNYGLDINHILDLSSVTLLKSKEGGNSAFGNKNQLHLMTGCKSTVSLNSFCFLWPNIIKVLGWLRCSSKLTLIYYFYSKIPSSYHIMIYLYIFYTIIRTSFVECDFARKNMVKLFSLWFEHALFIVYNWIISPIITFLFLIVANNCISVHHLEYQISSIRIPMQNMCIF